VKKNKNYPIVIPNEGYKKPALNKVKSKSTSHIYGNFGKDGTSNKKEEIVYTQAEDARTIQNAGCLN